MRIPYSCIKQALGGNVTEPVELRRLLTMRSFEIESLEEKDGDWYFEADVLPNRQHDCLCQRYFIKEVAAITGVPFEAPDAKLPEGAAPSVSVSVEDARCRRYILVEVSNFKNGPSPEWLAKKMAESGARSISALVDATNFALGVENQPTHAFDADKVTGGIVVRAAAAGEKMTTLDGKDVTLEGGELVIADQAGVLALAGVKGGNRATVTEATTRAYLESANFEGAAVRRAAQRYDLRTDSSKRFEAQIAPELAERGMGRLVETLAGLCPGATFSGAADHWPRRAHPYKTGVSAREASQLLGREVSATEAKRALEAVGCKLEELADPNARILEIALAAVGKPYKYGASVLFDAPREFDCSSLVAYACAQAGLSAPRMSIDQYVWSARVEEKELRPGDLVFSCIGGEVVHRAPQTKTLDYAKGTPVPEPGVDHVGVYVGDGEVIHATHVGGDVVKREKLVESPQFQTVVGYGRATLVDEPRLVATVPAERLDLRAPEDLIEEIGRLGNLEELPATPLPESAPAVATGEFALARAIRAALTAKDYSEIMTSSFSADGDIEVQKPANAEKPRLRASLAPGFAAALERGYAYRDWLGGGDVRAFEIGKAFAPAESARLVVGVVSAKARQAETIEIVGGLAVTVPASAAGAVAYAEVPLDGVSVQPTASSLAPLPKDHRFQTLSAYPYSARDVAVWVPGEGGEEAKVADVIRAAAGPLLAKLYKFDEFTKRKEGEPVRTSYAFRLILQSMERTLADAEIAAATDAVYAALRAQGWEIR
jgi:phenylalanyl-tRNA synthetase beta subunit